MTYDAVVPEDVKAYYVADVTGNVATLKEFENNIIPAEQGFIINAPTNTTHPLYKTTASAAANTNMLVGTTAKTTVGANSVYALGMVNDNTVGLLTYTGTTIAANKAYLPMTAADNAGKALYMNIEGNATGIDELKTEQDAPVYDLFGQRVTELKDGHVYIRNHSKFIHKSTK